MFAPDDQVLDLAVAWEKGSIKPSLQEFDSRPTSRSLTQRRNACPPQRMNPAFTLIELLVVIAVIAVLAAMLLPTLSMAKNRAQTAIDLNNLHQILLAIHLYAGDNRDSLPNSGYGTGTHGTEPVPNWCVGNPSGIPNAADGTQASYLANYANQVKSFKGLNLSGAAVSRNNAAQLSPYLKNEKVLRCPSDVPNSLMYKRAVVLTSYIMSTCTYCSFRHGPCTMIPMNGLPTCVPYKLGLFKADDILMWENDETLLLTDPGSWNDAANAPVEGISARHGKGATVGNADGSAERVLLGDYYYWAWGYRYKWPYVAGVYNFFNGQPLPNRVWCVPVTPDGT